MIAAAAVAFGLSLAAPTMGPSSDAVSPPRPDGDAIALSVDGTTWTDALQEPLLLDPGLVPGDSVTSHLWVRNDGPGAGDLAIVIVNTAATGTPGDPWFEDLHLTLKAPGQAAQSVPFSQVQDGMALLTTSLDSGSAVELALSLEFPAASTSGNEPGPRPAVEFDLEVNLAGSTAIVPGPPATEPTVPGPSPDSAPTATPPPIPDDVSKRPGDLPQTGSDLLWVIGGSALAIGVGAGLARASNAHSTHHRMRRGEPSVNHGRQPSRR